MIYAWRHNSNKKNSGHYSPWLKRSGIVAVVLLTIVYIGLTNDVATQGYRLKTLQQETKRLEETNAELGIQVAAVESLQRLESASNSLALTPLERIEYLTTPTTAVAVR